MRYNLFMGVNEMHVKNITVTVSVRVSVTVRVSLVWRHLHFLFRKISKLHGFLANWDSAKRVSAKWGITILPLSVNTVAYAGQKVHKFEQFCDYEEATVHTPLTNRAKYGILEQTHSMGNAYMPYFIWISLFFAFRVGKKHSGSSVF